MKDQQGNEIVMKGAYLFVFGQPGNDTTTVVVNSINEDGTVNVYDVNFKFELNGISPEKLFKPLKYGWDNRQQEKLAALEYGAIL